MHILKYIKLSFILAIHFFASLMRGGDVLVCIDLEVGGDGDIYKHYLRIGALGPKIAPSPMRQGSLLTVPAALTKRRCWMVWMITSDWKPAANQINWDASLSIDRQAQFITNEISSRLRLTAEDSLTVKIADAEKEIVMVGFPPKTISIANRSQWLKVDFNVSDSPLDGYWVLKKDGTTHWFIEGDKNVFRDMLINKIDDIFLIYEVEFMK